MSNPYPLSPIPYPLDVRLAQISDLHLSPQPTGEGMVMLAESGALLDSTIAEINALAGLDAVLVSGDLIDDGAPATLDAAIGQLNRLRFPWYAIPGNHDAAHPPEADALDRRRFYTHLQNGAVNGVAIYDGAPERGSYTTVIKPGVRLIGLDSNVPGDWYGRVDAGQLAWLRQTLDTATEPLVVLMVHHPLHRVFGGWQAPLFGTQSWHKFFCFNGPEVQALLDHYPQVRLVVSGHVHVSAVEQIAGRVHLAAPALDSYPLAYRTIQVQGDGDGWRCAWQQHSPASPALRARAQAQLESTTLAAGYDPSDLSHFARVSEGPAPAQQGSCILPAHVPQPNA
jgi:Icc protein